MRRVHGSCALEAGRLAFAIALAAWSHGSYAEQAKTSTQLVLCGANEFRYVMLVPVGKRRSEGTSPPAERPPAVLLLHGAGDTPEPMVDAWRETAIAEGIVLIAPALPRDLRFEAMAPAVFECVVEDAKRFALVDERRVYLFGNSMGGYLAYDAAMLRSEYFAAAAVHAMQISPEYDWIIESAKRKIPIAIYIGDRDPLVPAAGVRRTRDLLVQHGFPVRYTEIRGHDHNYYGVSDAVNRDAWAFLKPARLGQQSGRNDVR